MKYNRRVLAIVAATVLLIGALVGGLVLSDAPARAFAQDGAEAQEDAAEGPDRPITGPALEQASQTALDYVGQGRVTGTEVGDEEGYYEIEVTLDNGRQVDVHLDQEFNVLSQIDDVETAGEAD